MNAMEFKLAMQFAEKALSGDGQGNDEERAFAKAFMDLSAYVVVLEGLVERAALPLMAINLAEQRSPFLCESLKQLVSDAALEIKAVLTAQQGMKA